MLRDKLTEAINARNNDVKTFVWKLARKQDGTQEEIRLMDATPEQLNKFYKHCDSMLNSTDKLNPGRKVLLGIINEQREKCNVEMFLRKLETGAICADGKGYPRYLYLQDLRAFIDAHRDQFPANELKNISIATCTSGLPREFERISIDSVLSACLDTLGYFDNKHITFSFILNLGVYLTPAEMKEFTEKDKDGNTRSKLEVIKERLNINPSVRLTVKSSGLNFTELRAMIGLRPKKYSELTTDQLATLRNKVLFRLENEVMFHASQWEKKMEELEKVAKSKGVVLE